MWLLWNRLVSKVGKKNNGRSFSSLQTLGKVLVLIFPFMGSKLYTYKIKLNTERQISCDISHMWTLILKMMQMNLFTKQRQTHRYWKQTYGYWRENMVGRGKSGAWDEHTHTTTYKITNKDLLCSTGNSTQYSVITYMKKERMNICICITESLCCTPETNTTL